MLVRIFRKPALNWFGHGLDIFLSILEFRTHLINVSAGWDGIRESVGQGNRTLIDLNYYCSTFSWTFSDKLFTTDCGEYTWQTHTHTHAIRDWYECIIDCGKQQTTQRQKNHNHLFGFHTTSVHYKHQTIQPNEQRSSQKLRQLFHPAFAHCPIHPPAAVRNRNTTSIPTTLGSTNALK